MNLASASQPEERDMTMPLPTPSEEDDVAGILYARKSSVVAKLFGKNQPHVAVVDQVMDHQNGPENDNSSAEVSENSEVFSNGNGATGLDDEDDDDEFIPPSDEEDSGASDDDDDDELDDEETSMRSLLLPMATYAKQLLFLHEDEAGEFDEQDAELWDSPEEKREWIDRYEARNRAYIDQYGCRIDAPANPELKKRLRRERSREAKYSLVLLALALAYLVRLFVGPGAVQVNDSATPALSPVPADNPILTPPVLDADHGPNDRTWWTVWTESLVVRTWTWPRSLLTSLQSSDVTSSDQGVQSPTLAPHLSPASETSTTKAATQITSNDVPSPSEEIFVQEEATTLSSTATVESAEDAVDKPSAKVVEVEVSFSDIERVEPLQTTNNDDQVAPDISSSSGSIAKTIEDQSDGLKPRAAEGSVGADPSPVQTSEDSESTTTMTGENVLMEETDHRSHNELVQTPVESLQRCLDMFYTLMKMKNDANVKATALSECNQAVEDASNPTSTEWIQARLLRGDMKSLVQLFREAQIDYEAALLAAPATSSLRSEIETKIACNRWIQYYHTKQFKELRKDCLQLDNDGSTQTPDVPDRVIELARDWLRAFRKETKVLEVLTKTRAWTLYRPTIPQTHE